MGSYWPVADVACLRVYTRRPANFRDATRQNESKGITHRCAWIVGVDSANLRTKRQRKKSLHTEMRDVPRRRYQGHRAIGQEKQPSHTRPHNCCVQKATERLPGCHCLVRNTSSERRPDSANFAGEWRKAGTPLLDRSRFPRFEQVHERCDFQKPIVAR